jgi:membrane-bound lytic murein transglycosylase D
VLALLLSACAPVNPPIENKSLFINQADFHITELNHSEVLGKSAAGQMVATDSLWQVMRDGFKLPALNAVVVNQQAQRYASGRYHLQPTFDRASMYLFYIVQELRSRNMPTEIALLPLIESSYSPIQKGALHHAGIWGIMPVAGKHLGLIQNANKDERRDILRSTQGALDLLQELHTMFGDWQLALIAYNWGPGNVARAVAKAKAQKLSPTYENLNLPKAVRDYLVWVAGYKAIIMHPEKYGVNLPPLENVPYFVVIDVTRDIDISVVLELAEIPKDTFLRLNPSFNRHVILSAPEQKILLPYKNAENFQNNLNQYLKPLTSWKQTDSTLPTVKKKK